MLRRDLAGAAGLELHDILSEEQVERQVGGDAQLPVEPGKLHQKHRSPQPPGKDAGQRQPEHLSYGRPAAWRGHLRAVRTAQGIRQRLNGLNRDRGGDPLTARIAVNSGLAMAWDIGSPKRREYTVLGDVVNTASRMQSEVAAPGQIVISRATFDRVRDQITARPLGERSLRGRSGLVEVFEVDD